MEKQEFPKWMYGPEGQARLVDDPGEMDALKGWAESPAEVKPAKKAKA